MIPACATRADLVQQIEERLPDWFQATRHKVFFLETDFPDNPVASALRSQETALHEAQVVDNATWRRLCPRADHGHVLIGPLLHNGELVGAVAVTREHQTFEDGDVRLMNRICLHASTRLAELAPELPGLTPRETEVAEAARRGLRNREIAGQLGLSEYTVKQMLKSVFRKLGLSSRTQLASAR